MIRINQSLWICFFALAAAISAAASESDGRTFRITSGGLPTLEGSLGGTVLSNAPVGGTLSLTVNFGELSPANSSRIVRVRIPVAIDSSRAYAVSAQVQGPSSSADPNALQASDIGFGIQNLRPSGVRVMPCIDSANAIAPAFDNDPAVGTALDSLGRVRYAITLRSLFPLPRTIITGPPLSSDSSKEESGGYLFDLILAVTPQYYSASTTSFLLTLTIGPGPSIAKCKE